MKRSIKLRNYGLWSFFLPKFPQKVLFLLGCANKDLWALCAPIFIIVVYCKTAIFCGIRNNWYHSYNSTIIEIRDGNSSENFIPRGIEESRNSKITFLGDRGIWNLFLGVLGEFSRNESSPKSWKSPQNYKKILKKNSEKNFSPEFIFQSSECLEIIPKIDW